MLQFAKSKEGLSKCHQICQMLEYKENIVSLVKLWQIDTSVDKCWSNSARSGQTLIKFGKCLTKNRFARFRNSEQNMTIESRSTEPKSSAGPASAQVPTRAAKRQYRTKRGVGRRHEKIAEAWSYFHANEYELKCVPRRTNASGKHEMITSDMVQYFDMVQYLRHFQVSSNRLTALGTEPMRRCKNVGAKHWNYHLKSKMYKVI